MSLHLFNIEIDLSKASIFFHKRNFYFYHVLDTAFVDH